MNCVDVVKLAPRVRPAGNFVNRAAFIEMMKAGIRIGLQSAIEVLQVLPRVCIFNAPLCLRNLAHGNTERQRSMVVESSA